MECLKFVEKTDNDEIRYVRMCEDERIRNVEDMEINGVVTYCDVFLCNDPEEIPYGVAVPHDIDLNKTHVLYPDFGSGDVERIDRREIIERLIESGRVEEVENLDDVQNFVSTRTVKNGWGAL